MYPKKGKKKRSKALTRRANPICDILTLFQLRLSRLHDLNFLLRSLSQPLPTFFLCYEIPRSLFLDVSAMMMDHLLCEHRKEFFSLSSFYFSFFGAIGKYKNLYNLYLFRGFLDICLLAIKASGKNCIWPSSPSTNRNFSYYFLF